MALQQQPRAVVGGIAQAPPPNICVLQSAAPTPCLQMLMLLDGSWKLVYTSNSELLAILALSRLPLVSIGDITQRIDSAINTVENKVGGSPMT